MWSSGEEHVRVLAFMCIRRSTALQPNLFEFVLKVSIILTIYETFRGKQVQRFSGILGFPSKLTL